MAALRFAGVATYKTPEQAVEAFLYLTRHARRACVQVDNQVPVADPWVGNEESVAAASRLVGGRRGTLGEEESKALLSAFGFAVTRTVVAGSREGAINAARECGYPVVLKVVSPQVSHKTDVGGVILGLHSDDTIGVAFDQIRISLHQARPEAVFEGVTVQPMVDRSRGVELIVGARRDPTFGAIVLVGAGGTLAELLAEHAVGLAPLDANAALQLIDSLRIRSIMGEFRGRPALAIDAAADAVVRMSRLITEVSAVQDAEANTVLVTPYGATALDARVVLRSSNEVSATS